MKIIFTKTKEILILIIIGLCSIDSYSQTPTITSFTPSTGSVGTLVTITGTNLNAPTAFTIGGTAAIIVSNTGTTLVGMVMTGATTGAIQVTTSSGTANGSINFTVTSTSFPSAQQGNNLVGTGAVGNSSQGYSVAISADGNTAIVGGDQDNGSVGAAWIYTRNGGIWTQQGNKLVGSGAIGTYVSQGTAVAISADGNTVIIGGPYDNNSIGAAWVFTRSSGIWTQQGNKLVGTGAVNNPFAARQGSSVALSADGNTALVGGYYDNGGAGAIWVYYRSSGTWSQQGNKLIGTGAIFSASLGCSASISADGNTAIIGGNNDSTGVGAAWIFTRIGTTWSQQGSKLMGGGKIGIANFGGSVSISADGNTAIVGGTGDNNGIGAAWVYNRTGNTWTQQGNKLIGINAAQAYNGSSVSLSADGNTAIIGVYSDHPQGASCVYIRSGGVWTMQGNKLVGTGATGYSAQGSAVSLSADGNTVIIGGDYGNGTAGSGVGAAWVFIPCSTPDTPVLSTTSSANCGTQSTTLSVIGGNINGQGNWQWYSGSCGSTSVGSGTSITVLPSTTTTYYVRGEGNCISSPGNCANISITVNSLPVVSFSSLGASNCYNSVVTLTGNPSGGVFSGNGVAGNIFNASITGSGNQTITYTYTDGNNCTDSSSQSTLILPLPTAIQMCEVTVDSLSGSNQYNEVYWDKTAFSSNIDSVIVYRYVPGTASYQRIGAVSNDHSTLSKFTDNARNIGSPHGGDPTYTYYQYKIAAHDTCGNISPMSNYHSSINFYITGSTFFWNAYVIENGTPINGYNLMKDSLSNGNWQIVTSTVGTTASDPYFSTSPNASYRVDALGFNCVATRTPITVTHSNIMLKNNTFVSEMEFKNSVSIFPNPFTEQTTISFSETQKNTTIKIMDIAGREIKNLELIIKNEKSATLDMSGYAKGVYFVQITDEKKNVVNRRVVVQ